MIILNKESKLATILEVGEDDVTLHCAGENYTVELTEESREMIHRLVDVERQFTAAFNPKENKLLLDSYTEWNEETLYDLLEKQTN